MSSSVTCQFLLTILCVIFFLCQLSIRVSSVGELIISCNETADNCTGNSFCRDGNCSCDDGYYPNIASDTCLPLQKINLTVGQTTQHTVHFVWEILGNLSGAKLSYTVNITGINTTFSSSNSTMSSFYTVSNLKAGHLYQIDIEATDTNRGYSISNVTTDYALTLPIMPHIRNDSNSTSIRLFWNATGIDGATKLLLKEFADNTLRKNISYEIVKENAVIGNFTPGTLINVTVESFIERNFGGTNYKKTSEKSYNIQMSVRPSPPANFSTNVTKDTILISIDAGPGNWSSFFCILKLACNDSVLSQSQNNSTSCSFSSLLPYTIYSVSVIAESNGENSTKSLDGNVTTAESVPGPPIIGNLSSVGNNSGVMVTWAAPTNPNGVLKTFEIYWSRSLIPSDMNKTASVPYSVNSFNLSSTEAPSGSKICCRIRANTSIGFGNWSKKECIHLDDRKSENVSFLNVSADTTSISLSWKPPNSTNGVIKCYYVILKSRNRYYATQQKNTCLKGVILEKSNGSCNNDSLNNTGFSRLETAIKSICSNYSLNFSSHSFNTNWSFSQLSAGAPYLVTIFAVNRAGPGELSSEDVLMQQSKSLHVSYPIISTILDRSVTIQWKPPNETNGVILQYFIAVSSVSSSNPTKDCFELFCSDCNDTRVDFIKLSESGKQVLNSLKNRCNHTNSTNFFEKNSTLAVKAENLRPYTEYSIRIWPINSLGPGENISLLNRTAADKPTPPQNVQVRNASSLDPKQLSVHWDIPKNENGPISDYFVVLSNDRGSQVVRKNSTFRNHTFLDLHACDEYSAHVIAANTAGNSSVSVSSTGFTRVAMPKYIPKPILNVISDTSINASWNPVISEVCHIEYTVTLKSIHDNRTTRTSRTSIVFGNLLPHTNYTAVLKIEVSGDIFGAVSTSRISNESEPSKTEEGKPGHVQELSCVQPQNEYNVLRCSWKAPSKTNGLITEYLVRYKVGFGEYINKTVKEKSINLTQKIRPDEAIIVQVSARTKVGYGMTRIFNYTLESGPPNQAINNTELRKLLVPQTVNDPTTQIKLNIPCNIFNDQHGKIEKMIVVVRANISRVAIEKSVPSMGTWKSTSKGLNGPYDAIKITCSSKRRRRRAISTFTETTVVTIGTNVQGCTEQICNGQLEPGTNYEIAIRGFTLRSNLAVGFVVIPTQSVPFNIIIPICIVALVVILSGALVALVIVWRRRKQGRPRHGVPGRISQNNLMMTDTEEAMRLRDIRSTYQPASELARQAARGVDTPIPINMFPAFVHEMNKDCRLLYTDAFNELKHRATVTEHDMNLTTDEAGLQSNRLKNRFANILPFDHSRVCLSSDDDPTSGMDYINANYISGHRRRREFIASQGPLAATLDDFWRMIWEQEVTLIVMLTLCVERGRNKCEQYWPQDDETRVYGDIAVRLYSQSILPAYAVRLLDVMCGVESRRITHLQMLTWEDFNAPNVDHLCALMEAIHSHLPVPGSTNDQAATVVHCSAGVGRTGTLIVLDRLTNMVDDGTEAIDINGVIVSMRTQRRHMVQSEKQYIFIHEFMLHYLSQRPRGLLKKHEESPEIVVRTPSNGNAQHEEVPAFCNSAYRSDTA